MSIDRGSVPRDHAGLSSLALQSTLMLANSSNAKRIRLRRYLQSRRSKYGHMAYQTQRPREGGAAVSPMTFR